MSGPAASPSPRCSSSPRGGMPDTCGRSAILSSFTRAIARSRDASGGAHLLFRSERRD
jgi:hypothetical protein